MRKFLLVISFLITIGINSFAQSLTEVRGIETKGCREVTDCTSGDFGNYRYSISFDDGFLFTNQNNFPVSVEAIWYEKGEEKDAKSFELAPKESYFWRVDYGHFHTNDNYNIGDRFSVSKGYVRYKAYKSSATVAR